jgi:hypothetical protein
MADDTLPGLSDPATGRPRSELLEAIETTLGELGNRGHVDLKLDAARVQLSRELAQVIGDKRRSGRTSTVGNDARVLMELLTGFIDEAAAAEGDALLRDAMEAWEAEIQSQAPAILEPQPDQPL